MNVISIVRGKIKDSEHNKDKKEPQCGSWGKVVKNKKLHRNRTNFNADIVQGSGSGENHKFVQIQSYIRKIKTGRSL